MYVALTRAEKRVYLTRAKSRFLWGERRSSLASPYFSETRKHLLPERSPATERELADDAFLDKLNRKEPAAGTVVNSGKSSKQVSEFRVGQIVEHGSFGKGIILMINRDVADVVFDGVGKKSLNLKFAPLKIVK